MRIDSGKRCGAEACQMLVRSLAEVEEK